MYSPSLTEVAERESILLSSQLTSRDAALSEACGGHPMVEPTRRSSFTFEHIVNKKKLSIIKLLMLTIYCI